MKKFVSLVLALVLALSMTACGQTRGGDPAPVEDIPTEKVTIRLGGLKGPTSMGMVKLLADAEEGLTANDYTFTMAASAPDLTPQFVKGEALHGVTPLHDIQHTQRAGRQQHHAAVGVGIQRRA